MKLQPFDTFYRELDKGEGELGCVLLQSFEGKVL